MLRHFRKQRLRPGRRNRNHGYCCRYLRCQKRTTYQFFYQKINYDNYRSGVFTKQYQLQKMPRGNLAGICFYWPVECGKIFAHQHAGQPKKLALTSSRPGKTQLINHFMVNKRWYLVDLPGFGFAKVSKTSREKWAKMIYDYLEFRENLMVVFLLIDSRIPPQQIDLDFINKLATMGLPFVLAFTKTDKVSNNIVNNTMSEYRKILSESWESLPQMFYHFRREKNRQRRNS